jgi:hypothetical protein
MSFINNLKHIRSLYKSYMMCFKRKGMNMASKPYKELPIIGRLPSGKTAKGKPTVDRATVLSWPSILWDQLLVALLPYPRSQKIEVMAGGILYVGGDPESSGPVLSDKASVQAAYGKMMDEVGTVSPTDVTKDRAYTPQMTQTLMGWVREPEWITGFVIRIL